MQQPPLSAVTPAEAEQVQGEEHARELEALRRERADSQQREEQARSRCAAAHAEALALRADAGTFVYY